jgi:hypothetical protein
VPSKTKFAAARLLLCAVTRLAFRFSIRERAPSRMSTYAKGILAATALVLALVGPVSAGAYSIRGRTVERGSYWQREALSAPLDPHSDADIAYWASHSSNRHLVLAGSTSGGIGKWAFATCYGRGGAPVWTVRGSSPRAQTFHIHCRGNVTRRKLVVSPGDNELVMFDLRKRVMLQLTGSVRIRRASHRIVASNWNFRDWRSNGLDRAYGGCHSCLGHRGFDSTYFGVRYAEAKAGKIPHVLKITLPGTVNSSDHVWPFVAGASGQTGIIPGGTRMRLKRAAYSRLLDRYRNPAKRAIIKALHRYGAITTDTGGFGLVLKLENTRGVKWSRLGITSARALRAIRITDFREVKRGWR